MRLTGLFSHVYKDLFVYNRKTRNLIIFTLLLAGYAQTIFANSIRLTVDPGGGAISNASNSFQCRRQCNVRTASNYPLTLFAVPDRGFRFAGWGGGCTGNLGPLCALSFKTGAQANARFVKVNTLIKPPAQALLLLQDGNNQQNVWNEYARQRFNNRCPVIYGGVLLEKDSIDTHSNMLCYRIEFGYYRLLKQSVIEQANSAGRNNLSLLSQPTEQQLGYELRAAVLSILNRHPDIKLTLVSQGDVNKAAQSFVTANNEERLHVAGLLTLVSDMPAQDAAQENKATGSPSFFLKLKATSKQGGKINAGLARLANNR